MKVDLGGRVALVTGGAGGIGHACAKLLAENGAAIAIGDKNLPGAREVCAEIAATGRDALAVEVDVSSSAAVQGMVDRTIERFQKIDILVHCAGGSIGRKDTVDLTDDEWQTVIRMNLDGTMFTTRAVARTMIPRRAGTMVMIASDRGLLGDKGRSAYAASKGGVIAYAKSLALELGQYEITVNALNPGTTNSHAIAPGTVSLRDERLRTDPLGKLSEPEDIAEMVLFLGGPAARFMTGQLITTRMRFG
jgi:NAD(P)-dependent dehydrogenase (short-subunit alcohol dehydrogenase family)